MTKHCGCPKDERGNCLPVTKGATETNDRDDWLMDPEVAATGAALLAGLKTSASGVGGAGRDRRREMSKQETEQTLAAIDRAWTPADPADLAAVQQKFNEKRKEIEMVEQAEKWEKAIRETTEQAHAAGMNVGAYLDTLPEGANLKNQMLEYVLEAGR